MSHTETSRQASHCAKQLNPLFPAWYGGDLDPAKVWERCSGRKRGLMNAFLEGKTDTLRPGLDDPTGRGWLAKAYGVAFPGRLREWLELVDQGAICALDVILPGLRPGLAREYAGLLSARLKGLDADNSLFEHALMSHPVLPAAFQRQADDLLNWNKHTMQRADSRNGRGSPSSGKRVWCPARAWVLAHCHGDMVGAGTAFMKLVADLDRAARLQLPVLLLGPTGSGKELALRYLHQRSDVVGPVITLNCAALPESLAEAELFGSAKGAYTGATERRGLAEEANGGTLFLDEFAALSPAAQAKLLRFLEDGSFRRVGENHERCSTARVVCASCEEERLGAAGFRQDLLHRVNGVRVKLPALKERLEDLPLLIQHFLIQRDVDSPDQHPLLDHDVLGLLRNYDWPGNFRELRFLVFSLADATAESIYERCKGLEPVIKLEQPESIQNSCVSEGERIRPLKWETRKLESRLVRKALAATGQDKRRAAHMLQISLPTLYAKLKDAEPL